MYRVYCFALDLPITCTLFASSNVGWILARSFAAADVAMTLQILPIAAAETASARAPHGWPLLRLGFRPFYPCAAFLAVVAAPLWMALFLAQVALVLSAAQQARVRA
jgi:hypothetical protein